ncbi:MAG: class I SAM-dependent methyltransferase, partial [Coprococcus sp.]
MEELLREIESTNPYKIVFSGGKNRYKKIVCARKVVGGKNVYQLEKYTEQQVFHENIDEQQLVEVLNKYFEEGFRQVNAFAAGIEYDVKVSKKGRLSVNKRQVKGRAINIEENNRRKKYILEEGMDIPVFAELGIFTREGKIVHSMYDKYKQINRFAEMVEDVLKNYHKPAINIVDFGCGKSYLTFILYYYLVEIKKIEAHITGLDLKEKVIDDCNALAKRFGYENLHFELGDIKGYKTDINVDMVVTLHACDVATDYALYNAICWGADYILSVPCCQHEVNKQIHSEKLSALTKYGIIKERTSALITDAIRGCVLESCGYKTDLMEFIN